MLRISTVLTFSGIAFMLSGSVSCAVADGLFYIERPKLALDASYKFEKVKRTVAHNAAENTIQDVFEKVTLETGGWVYHENLLEYRISLQPEWRQEQFEQKQPTADPGRTRDRDTSMLAYDTGVTLLKQKPLSFYVFANRNRRQIDLSYTQDTEIESDMWGARLNLKNAVLPASVGFISRQSVQTGFYQSEDDRKELQAVIRHNLKRSVTELNFLHDSGERSNRAIADPDHVTIDSVTTNSELTNTLFFTDGNRVRLDSQIYRSESDYGGTDYNTWTVNENLFWSHSQNFLARSAFNFNQREVNGVETENKNLNFLLTHRLEEVVTTNFGIGAGASDYVGGSEDRVQTNLDVIFRLAIPWGRVEVGSAFDYGVTRRGGGADVLPTEERLILRTGEDVYLRRENIELDSIVVTNISGTLVYTENIDYSVHAVGSEVLIRRTLSGNIADGQDVRVHYSYRVAAGYDDARYGQDYRFDLALWNFAYLTYTHDRKDQSILSGEPPPNLLDDTFDRLRLRFDVGWSETRLEYEKKDRNSGNSTTTSSVRQFINFRTFRSFAFNFSGQFGERKYTDTHEEETFYSVGTEMTWTPEWWCSFKLVYLMNDIAGDRQDMGYSMIFPKLQLNYGVWKASISYRFADQEDRAVENALERQRLFFIVSRELW